MTPSRLALVQEFERELRSPSLRDWFDTLRDGESALKEFADPIALRLFLHSPDVDARKPEVWRALVKGMQRGGTQQATLFVLGLLEPALGALVDKFAGDHLDVEDLWQETVNCALTALSNPQVPKRRAVLAGLILDTVSGLRHWLRGELSRAKNAAPMVEQIPAPPRRQPRATTDAMTLLAQLCRRAGVGREGFTLIGRTRLRGTPLSELAPTRSPEYYKLYRRRTSAEGRLKSWLIEHPGWSDHKE